MSMDGWSNISNESIIGCSIQHKANVYLIWTIDASSVSHTSENLADIGEDEMDKIKQDFGVEVSAIITDNAENMVKMRRI